MHMLAYSCRVYMWQPWQNAGLGRWMDVCKLHAMAEMHSERSAVSRAASEWMRCDACAALRPHVDAICQHMHACVHHLAQEQAWC